MKLSHLELTDTLREEFRKVLSGNDVQWNKHGIVAAFDRAVAVTAYRVADVERETT